MSGNDQSLPTSVRQEPSGAQNRATGGFLASFGVSVEPALLKQALTHRSWAYEHGGAPHNERLEFLGDSVLGQAVTVKLFHDFPAETEGELSRYRAALVSSVALAEVARKIGVGPELRLGRGEQLTGGREKDSILADAVEAIIGAVYLSTDPATAAQFVRDLIEPLLDDAERLTVSLDPKTSLQEMAAALGLPNPGYAVVGEGPDHGRTFTATVEIDGITGIGTGTSKKVAELSAAREAVLQLRGRTKK